ncbi:MAG: hypothetical protein Q3988_06615 [Gemella sp.]|nr:hypothetical protein [Gemella sp.]
MIKKILELIIRIAILVIFVYIKTESFSKFQYIDIVSSISMFGILAASFSLKFRDIDYLAKIFAKKSSKYIFMSFNVMLAIFLIWDAYDVNYLETQTKVVALGLLLIAIVETIDLFFIKETQEKLNARRKINKLSKGSLNIKN